MTGCKQCGAPCGTYSYCQTHRLARRMGDTIEQDSQPQRSTADSLMVQCVHCETVYDRTTQQECPECGKTRRQYVGPIAGESDVGGATVFNGETVVVGRRDDD